MHREQGKPSAGQVRVPSRGCGALHGTGGTNDPTPGARVHLRAPFPPGRQSWGNCVLFRPLAVGGVQARVRGRDPFAPGRAPCPTPLSRVHLLCHVVPGTGPRETSGRARCRGAGEGAALPGTLSSPILRSAPPPREPRPRHPRAHFVRAPGVSHPPPRASVRGEAGSLPAPFPPARGHLALRSPPW